MQTLHTKDSTHIGNAILIKELMVEDTGFESMGAYLKRTNQKLWLIETDFGNRVRFTDREIEEAFIRGNHVDYEQWSADRDELRRQSREEDH